MARTLTVQDAYQIMTALVHQATGQTGLTVTDTSSFVSAGESVLATGQENVINSLSLILNRTLIAVRPYNAKITLMEEIDTGLYSNRLRKISFYAKDPLASGNFNTDLFENLHEGYGHGANGGESTRSQWEQHQPQALEMNFGGSSTWQYCKTIYEDQLQVAFRDPAEFAAFVQGYLTEAANDIESQREAWNRMCLLNEIGALYDYSVWQESEEVTTDFTNGGVINLTAAFNNEYGTNYTSEELRTVHQEEFLKYFVERFKLESKYMTERSAARHNTMDKVFSEYNSETGEYEDVTKKILRHTPYDRQRVYLYAPFFTKAEANVLPQIFNPKYLDIGTQYQEVTYWQAQSNRPAVNVRPAVIDPTNPARGQITGNQVSIPYVLGLIVDKDAMMTNFQAEISRSTSVEARKGYRNVWTTFLKNAINDPTENAVLFYMAD